MKLKVAFILLSCAAVLLYIGLLHGHDDHVRADCFGSIADQVKQAGGVFDITITDSEYNADNNSCEYIASVNSTLKITDTYSKKEILFSEPLEQKLCVKPDRASKNCLLEGETYFLLTQDGHEKSLNRKIPLHFRFNYLISQTDKEEIEELLNYTSSESD
jgi:hypothetical protein